ncbi:hypothetical protein GLAREA_02881 [Glarea lozoyensis ATCC 20868]|uniref:Uncharacterized protein n=1 Tax=Glarea lozoyensis (strain ATCC 20868 / MF5171) TaxID=1116229 RepID=S3CKC0_GLAL2|nr:uncharacterized protein GLAREA_02881 [Glarea lozoyensis ATCC 20868]EPE26967.1 hypothetical protein GLAREA_02881 [Glarea lozoyensis ATCC 20868]
MPPAKAIKTERTHEENQERAYIAASRRSDRSLEARVESARRASEIHKRRTGRSLRVTEQDVVNEEMYEEEDDDLPGQYRRLTAHLQTPSADFNRKLSAYLTTNISMRAAVEQAVFNSYAQQQQQNGGMPQFGNSMYPSPMIAHQAQQQLQSPISPSMRSPSFRQAPYPPRPQQQQQQQMQANQLAQSHQRSATLANIHDVSANARPSPIVTDTERRQSLPVIAAARSPVETRSPLSATATTPKERPSFPPGSFTQSNIQKGQNTFSMQQPFEMNSFPTNTGVNYGPMNTAMTGDAQGFLGSSMNPNDQMSNMMMVGNTSVTPNFFGFEQQASSTGLGKYQTHPTQSGLHSTLAPSDLDANPPLENDFLQSNSFFDDALNAGSNGQTPVLTPGDPWESYVNFDDWNNNPMGSQSSQ